ncbi:MAG: CHC2 zinc finger domain-containing protein, partial [Blastocatellia bacterium]
DNHKEVLMGKDWVDFRLIKDAVSMQMVLDRYGINRLRRSGDELRGRCPIHKGEGDRTFHVNLVKGAFNCFSCKAHGNILDLVAALENCSVRDAALKLRDMFGVGESQPLTVDIPAPSTEATKEPDEGKKESGAINPPLPFRLMVDFDHEYGLSRGLTVETLAHFGAGFCRSKGTFAGRFINPLHNETGELVGYAGRAIDDNTEPRYLFPSKEKGFHKSHVVFNLNRVLDAARQAGIGDCDLPLDHPVIVVEGFFSVMTLYQHGYSSIVSLLGSSLSAQQEDLLARYFKRAILLFDGDDAGRAATNDCLQRLGRRLWVTAISLRDGIQPDELSRDSVAAFIESL